MGIRGSLEVRQTLRRIVYDDFWFAYRDTVSTTTGQDIALSVTACLVNSMQTIIDIAVFGT